MADQLIDPSLAVKPDFSQMGLSATERAALENVVTGESTLAEFKEQDEKDRDLVERSELRRIQAENEAMRAQLGTTTSEMQNLRSGYDNISGQLTAMQQTSQQAQEQAAAEARFALTPEELEQHGEMLPILQKVVGKSAYEIEQEVQRRLAAEKAVWQQEATAPLQQKLESVEQSLQAKTQREKAAFQTSLVNEIAALGFGSVDQLTQMPEFQVRHVQKLAPGVPTAWGDVLKSHIDNQNLGEAVEMLKDFRNSIPRLANREDTEIPASRSPAAPLSPSEDANLRKREELTKIYIDRMEAASMGNYPQGMTRASYSKAQRELREQIDAIPTT